MAKDTIKLSGESTIEHGHVSLILAKVIQIGAGYSRLISDIEWNRAIGLFKHSIPEDVDLETFLKKISLGKRGKPFADEFWVGKKHDGSLSCQAERFAHKSFVKFCKLILPGYARLFEENNAKEMEKAIIRAKNHKTWPIICVDPLDNTRGFLLRLFNADHAPAHQFSVNFAISYRDGTAGFGCFYLPLKDTLYYSFEGKAYKIENASQRGNPEAAATEIKLNLNPKIPEKLRVVTNNGAVNIHNSEEKRQRAKDKDDKLCDMVSEISAKPNEAEGTLLRATGLDRLALLFDGKADLAISRAGMRWWDVRSGFEICSALGLSVGIKQDDRMPSFPDEKALPDLYYAKPEILKALGLKIVYGKDAEIEPATKKRER